MDFGKIKSSIPIFIIVKKMIEPELILEIQYNKGFLQCFYTLH